MQKLFFTAIALLTLLTSCEKEIEIIVDDADTKYVVEANLSQEAGSAIVKITKSLGFSQNVAYPTVSDALVLISHNGQTDTLTETGDGVYTHPTLAAIVGDTYTLTVQPDADNIFTSTAIMPALVPFDSIRQENLTTDTTDFPQRPSPEGEFFIVLTPIYTDAPTPGNRYQFMLYKNNALQDNITVYDDQVNNGATNNRPVFLQTKAGDTITIDMQCLDKDTYDYFFALEETISQSSAAPANPKSNIVGGALGYFKLHYTQKRTLIIR
jgi:hypothetical protein